MRRLFVSLIFVLLMTGTARARELVQGDLCLVPADQTVSGNLYVVCRDLRIDGRVTGNVIGGATKATITGVVEGDILMAAGQLDLRGTVGDDIVFAGVVLRILPGATFDNSGSDLFSLTITTLLENTTTFPGSITGVGYQMLLKGAVEDEVSFWGSGLEIDGSVAGNVDATVGDAASDGLSRFPTFVIPFQFDIELLTPGLRVAEDARIDGYIHYASPIPAEIPENLVAQTEFSPIDARAEYSNVTMESDSLQRNVNLYFSQVAQEFATLGLIGIVVMLLAPRVLQDPLRYLQSRPLTCMGVSVFTLIVMIPVGLAIFTLSLFIIFILSLLRLDDLVFSIGALLGIVNIGGVSIFAFVFGFLSRVIVGFAIGRSIMYLAGRYTPTPQGQLLSLLIGVVVLSLATPLPLVGLAVYGLAAALGLGAIMSVLQGQIRASREAALPHLPEDDLLPPPPLESVPTISAPGTDNLPPGFMWWNENEDL